MAFVLYDPHAEADYTIAYDVIGGKGYKIVVRDHLGQVEKTEEQEEPAARVELARQARERARDMAQELKGIAKIVFEPQHLLIDIGG